MLFSLKPKHRVRAWARNRDNKHGMKEGEGEGD